MTHSIVEAKRAQCRWRGRDHETNSEVDLARPGRSLLDDVERLVQVWPRGLAHTDLSLHRGEEVVVAEPFSATGLVGEARRRVDDASSCSQPLGTRSASRNRSGSSRPPSVRPKSSTNSLPDFESEFGRGRGPFVTSSSSAELLPPTATGSSNPIKDSSSVRYSWWEPLRFGAKPPTSLGPHPPLRRRPRREASSDRG